MSWTRGDYYESYVGRWSRAVARRFVDWLSIEEGASWLDVGCGTGALAGTIVDVASPSRVVGVDPSHGFLTHAIAGMEPGRVLFAVADAHALPFHEATFDASVSGLVLNFLDDPARGSSEMTRVVRPGGTIAAYVWDYADGMELIRTRFLDFDDLWSPFLGGQGPGPAYVASLTHERRAALADRLRERVPVQVDGTISLRARAWAVRATRGKLRRRARPRARSGPLAAPYGDNR